MNPETLEQNQQQESPVVPEVEAVPRENIYPKLRHILLGLCLLFVICVLILLLYQNGKSIYDNGI